MALEQNKPAQALIEEIFELMDNDLYRTGLKINGMVKYFKRIGSFEEARDLESRWERFVRFGYPARESTPVTRTVYVLCYTPMSLDNLDCVGYWGYKDNWVSGFEDAKVFNSLKEVQDYQTSSPYLTKMLCSKFIKPFRVVVKNFKTAD